MNLTDKERIELRLKCLEPFIKVASTANIEQDTIIKKAEVAWEFAIKKPSEEKKELPLFIKRTSPRSKKTNL